MERIQGKQYYDPDIENEDIYLKLSRRQQNKIRTTNVQERYEQFHKAISVAKQKKQLNKVVWEGIKDKLEYKLAYVQWKKEKEAEENKG